MNLYCFRSRRLTGWCGPPTQYFGLPPASPGNNRSDGKQASHALTFKPDHSSGADHSINALLTNTHYGGFYNYRDTKSGETIRVNCPSILNPSLILSAKESMEKRSYRGIGNKRTKTSVKKYTYLLTELLFCTHCWCRFGGHLKT